MKKTEQIQRKILFVQGISFDRDVYNKFFSVMDFRNGANHYLNKNLRHITSSSDTIKSYLLQQRGRNKNIDIEFKRLIEMQVRTLQETDSQRLDSYFETLNFLRNSSITPIFKLKMQEQNMALNGAKGEQKKMLACLAFFPEFIQNEKNVNKILMSISPIKFIYITVLFWLQSQKKAKKIFRKFHSIEFTLYMLWQFHSSKIYPSKAQA